MIETGIVQAERHAIWIKFNITTATNGAIMQTTISSLQKTSFGFGDLRVGDWG